MGDTSIEWTQVRLGDGIALRGKTWNPVTGCSHASEGCDNCYAETLFKRFSQRWTGAPYLPWTEQNAKTNIRFHPERLSLPQTWKEPCGVFVNSMSDLFHPHVSFAFVNEVMRIVRSTPRHIYLVLTKRPAIMLRYFRERYALNYDSLPENLWLGTSVENQRWADARIPPLLAIPAEVRFLSVEPMIGPVNLDGALRPEPGRWNRGVDWVIAGGESGPGARPMDPEWPRLIRDQCAKAGVPFFFKQWGSNGGMGKRDHDAAILDGRAHKEWPELRDPLADAI